MIWTLKWMNGDIEFNENQITLIEWMGSSHLLYSNVKAGIFPNFSYFIIVNQTSWSGWLVTWVQIMHERAYWLKNYSPSFQNILESVDEFQISTTSTHSVVKWACGLMIQWKEWRVEFQKMFEFVVDPSICISEIWFWCLTLFCSSK